jgi:hypothetical protein
MPQQPRPTKEQTRAYLQERQRSKEPPPSIEEIRRQLGWFLKPDPRTA